MAQPIRWQGDDRLAEWAMIKQQVKLAREKQYRMMWQVSLLVIVVGWVLFGAVR